MTLLMLMIVVAEAVNYGLERNYFLVLVNLRTCLE